MRKPLIYNNQFFLKEIEMDVKVSRGLGVKDSFVVTEKDTLK
jgi:hypothetical protein